MDSVRVPYEELVEAYTKSLNTVLRGFRSAEGFDFLEIWVPDDDVVTSLLNLLEAAQDGGLKKISVVVGPKTWGTLDQARFKTVTGPLGTFEIKEEGASKVVEFSFSS